MRQLAILIPLGILGAIRWAVWLIRRIPAVLYKPYEADHREDMTVVTPVYQEDPEIFREAIDSWLANDIEEVICVIDETDVRAVEVARQFAADGHPVRIMITDVPGKRDALRRGWEAATTPLVALVDSDTLWADDVSERVCEPFADPDVGGVGTRQNVFNPTTVWERLNDSYLDYRYFDEVAAQTQVGQAVSCLSGRTAIYRREVLLENSEDFMGETFMGVPSNSGEDKRLTMLTLQNGYKTYMQQNARVWSTFPKDGSTFFKQRLRWARNTWRSDLRSLFGGWVFRHRFLAFTMIDKALAAFTLLVAPAYMIYGIITQNWVLCLVLAGWWFISRSAKYLPHLMRKPGMIFMMPVVILMSFVLALVKIYALLTIRKQRWLTRDVEVIDGEIVRTEPGGGGVLPTPGMASVDPVSGSGTVRKGSPWWMPGQKTLLAFIGVLVLSGTVLVEQAGAGECLLPDEVIRDESLDPLYHGTSDDRELQAFVAPRVAQTGCRWPDNVRAIVLAQDGIRLQAGGEVTREILFDGASALNFGQLVDLIDDPEWIETVERGTFLVKATVFQRPGTLLFVEAPEVREVRLADLPYVHLGGEGAQASFRGVRVTSWSVADGGPDRVYRDGRPFVLYQRGSRLDIYDSEMEWLGSDRTGAYGVSWRLGSSTGEVFNSIFANNYFGVYTYEAADITYRENIFRDNVFYGADPHDNSIGLLFEGNEAHGNGSHGLVISRSVKSTVMRDNYVWGNGGNGIVIDYLSTGNTVVDNQVESNAKDGIVVLDSGRNDILNNVVRGHRVGIRVNGENSDGNVIQDNEIFQSGNGIEVYEGATDNVLRGNTIIDSTGTGIRIGAVDNTIVDGSISGGNVGVDFREDSEATGISITNVTDGVTVKNLNVAATLSNLDVDASRIGVRVDRGALATLSDSEIRAETPIKGSRIDEGTGVIATRANAPGWPIFGTLGFIFVVGAFLLEGVRRLRNKQVAGLGNAPAIVANVS